MALYKEQGIVLRAIKLGEADRIVTLLTQGSGKIRAVAKGIRKTRSKFGARLEPFTHVDLLMYKGRELDIVTQADIITSFRTIRDDYSRFAAGEMILEAADRVIEDRERNTRMFMLVLNALRRLVEDPDPGVVADGYLLRVTAMAGFRPSLSACAECGKPDVGRFSIQQGGMVCDGCRSGGTIRVGEGTVPYLTALLDDRDVSVRDDTRREASNIVRAYLEYHLNRPLRAWAHVPR
ncbi:MAG TPA: DNA repair protein RecO [Actinomycetota bacterium]|nr:DNA repair protein RecO [Actinomycetota bacterium]